VNIPVYRPNAFEALEIAIEMGVKVITTSAGNPAKLMGRAKEAGLTVLHKVSSVKNAQKAQDAGVDGVVAMGYEAGGHAGRENVTTFCLIPQLADRLSIPIVASGGIADARGVVAAFALGAEGVEMGTRFVATDECPVPPFFKEGVVSAGCESTVLLGKEAMPIRVLKNKLTEFVSGMDKTKADEAIIKSGDAGYVQPNAGAGGSAVVRPAAGASDYGADKDSAVMPCGQIAGLVSRVQSIAEIFSEITEGVKKVSGRIGVVFDGWSL
jgi:enoyl-[acyl-carrier protein] reductase II